VSFAAPVLIPAYQPGAYFVPLVEALLALGAPHIVLVDDGGGPDYAAVFTQAAQLDPSRVRLLRHAINLGKGAALKTGLNYALVEFPNSPGVVTADADGQHAAADIAAVAARLAANPNALVMGVRSFEKDVPFRSRIGNAATRFLMRMVAGQKVTDTQTGLRGIPAQFIPHLLRLAPSGYEFELDMLLACKFQSCPIVEEPIRTIYLEGNQSSHFQPVRDSMRIYFLLFRFSLVSLMTAVVDNVVFALVFRRTGNVAQSQIAGRIFALIFNYSAARTAVFHSRQRHAVVLPKYLALVAANAVLSYILIEALSYNFGISVIPAKLAVETLLFIANFAIQRDFVFTRKAAPPAGAE
jgi:glycosyltransferase involved in cell wall biosynthesis